MSGFPLTRPTESRLLWALVALGVVARLVTLPQVLHTPMTGDEVQYVDGARALAHSVRGLLGPGPADLVRTRDVVVDNGWFMPGVSLLLAPLFVVLPGAGMVAVRLVMGTLTLALFLLVTWLVRRQLGVRYAAVLLVFPGLMPMYLLMGYTAWGDLTAGLVAVLVLLWVLRGARRLQSGTPPRVWEGLVLGGLAATILYLRSSALPFAVGILGLAGLVVVAHAVRAGRPRGVPSVVVAALTFVIAVLPWSLVASAVFHDRVLTTTSVPLSRAVAFGDPDRICFGPCPGSNVWWSSVTFADNLSDMTGVSTVEVQRQMAVYALRDLTLPHYLGAVLGDFGRYLLQPSDKAAALAHDAGAASTLGRLASGVLYFSFLTLACVASVLTLARPRRAGILRVVLTLSIGAFMVQPFVHPGSGRYWPVFAPLLALAAVPALELLRGRQGRASGEVAR